MIVALAQALYYALLHLPAKILIRHKVEIGPSPAELRRPLILASNHVSRLDPFLLVLLPLSIVLRIAPIYFLTSEAEYRVWWQRPFLKLMGSYPVKRVAWSVDDYLGSTIEKLRRGKSVMIFPEGRIRRPGREASAKPGVVILAKTSGAAILPLRIEWLGSRSVNLTLGDAIVLDDDGRSDRELAREIVERIDSL